MVNSNEMAYARTKSADEAPLVHPKRTWRRKSEVIQIRAQLDEKLRTRLAKACEKTGRAPAEILALGIEAALELGPK